MSARKGQGISGVGAKKVSDLTRLRFQKLNGEDRTNFIEERPKKLSCLELPSMVDQLRENTRRRTEVCSKND